MSEPSGVTDQKPDDEVAMGDDRTKEASRASGRIRERFEHALRITIELTKRLIRTLRCVISTERPALLFFAAAIVFFVIAYPFYTSATGAPKVTSHGFLLVLTDDPTTSLQVTLQYSSNITYFPKGKEPGAVYKSSDIPNVGDDKIKGLILELHQIGKAGAAPHRYLAVFGGDARLKDVNADTQVNSWSKTRANIEFRTISSTSDIQAYEGNVNKRDDSVQLAGTLTSSVTDTAAGRTFVRVPSLGSVLECSRCSWGTTNETVRSNEVLVAGKKWFKPNSVKYVAKVGILPVQESIDEDRPSLDTTDPTLLEWSGSEIRFPEAQLSDNLAEQDSQKKIFLAGVFAGISGGLLVEGFSRVRRVRFRRGKQPDKPVSRTSAAE